MLNKLVCTENLTQVLVWVSKLSPPILASDMNNEMPPKYLIIYRCEVCDQESGFTDLYDPYCRFCKRADSLVLVSKTDYTSRAVNDRLKIVADRMLFNLTRAYEVLPKYDDNIVSEGADAEMELLRLMDLVKKFRDKLYEKDFKEGG